MALRPESCDKLTRSPLAIINVFRQFFEFGREALVVFSTGGKVIFEELELADSTIGSVLSGSFLSTLRSQSWMPCAMVKWGSAAVGV
jgi:hypothetical protein